MRLSYCTVCNNDIDNILETLEFNKLFLKQGESELVILCFNDNDIVEPKLRRKYAEYLDNKTIKVFYEYGEVFDYIYCKNKVHDLASGTVVFNLESNNFLTNDLHFKLLMLKSNQIVIPNISQNKLDQNTRIGLHKSLYKNIGSYICDQDCNSKSSVTDFLFKAKRKGINFIISEVVRDALPRRIL